MYTLAMGYDNMHRIKSKSQHLTQDNVQFNGTLNAGYDLSYTYGTDTGKKFQLANVKDVNYRTEETPSESENVNNNHAYEYDANGNLVYVNTSRTKKDGVADEKTAERKLKWDEENRLLASDDNGFVTNYWYDANGNLVYVNTSRTKKDGMTDEKAAERKLKWDEENRLLASDDNGFVTNYWYDADGERTVKTSGESDQVYVNSEFAGGRTNTAKFSLYVSPYLVANQGGRYTKHIYIGSQRVVSKIGDFDSYGSDPRRIQYAGSETDGLSVDYKVKYTQQLQVIKDNYATFAVPYNGEDNNDYVDGKGFCCNDGSLEAAQARVMARAMKNNFQEGDSYEKMQFYYHPDHLGSSSYITNLEGEVVQHIEYVPFGEVFVEERNNIWNTPYLFNAKEFDEETGMYYYGARYYESRLSLWMSVDRFAEKYKTSPYCFTLDNPICHYDERGDSTILYATRLPMDNKKIQSALSMATHTFIVVKRNGKPSVKFSFGSKTDNPFGGQLVKVSYMDEEKSMKGEAPSNFVKNRIVITPPSGMTVEQFDEMVIKTGNSFGNNPNITYCLEPFKQTQGNCNSSSSTLLYKAGVPLSRIKDLRKQISGLVWGFGDIKPWTVEEQSKAVQRQRELDQLRNEMMNTIILNKY